jgi:hypothetical protein
LFNKLDDYRALRWRRLINTSAIAVNTTTLPICSHFLYGRNAERTGLNTWVT